MVIGDLRFPIFLHITHRRTVGALSDPCCPIARFDTVISKSASTSVTSAGSNATLYFGLH